MTTTTPAEVTRAVWFTKARQIEIREAPARHPKTGEIVVRALASGISQGTEMMVLRGDVDENLELDLPTLEGRYGFPIKFGYASVGRVLATGQGVSELNEGDVVFVHHPHQTEYVVPADMAVRLLPGSDPYQATLLANLETAVNAMLDANPRLGDRVIVFGQGVVGLLITQLLSRAGAAKIIAVDPDPHRTRLAGEIGSADDVVAPEAAVEVAMQISGGSGLDIAIEASGNPNALNTAVGCLGFQGTAVVVSWFGRKKVPLDLGGSFHRKRLRIISSQVGHIDPTLSPRWDRRRRLELARDLLTDLSLAPLLTHKVPFESACSAYELLTDPERHAVHVVLTYGDEHV